MLPCIRSAVDYKVFCKLVYNIGLASANQKCLRRKHLDNALDYDSFFAPQIPETLVVKAKNVSSG